MREQGAKNQTVQAIRRFNRFYTRRAGVLEEGHLDSPFSLAEVRIFYELAHRENASATELVRELAMDAGYLSRLLRRLERGGYTERSVAANDRRSSVLRLTRKGRMTFAGLDQRASREVGSMIGALPPARQRKLVGAMSEIESLLGASVQSAPKVVLRAPRAGDLGWVVERHGALYADEYGFDDRFEGLVAKIVGEYVEHRDEMREACWIAEFNGERAGAVFLVRKTDTVCKLRLLLVEPSARGHGIGKQLVEECIRFARAAGYRKMTLWTQSILLAARSIYVRAGFSLVGEESHTSFGHKLVAETWELKL